MPLFTYKARGQNGEAISGEVVGVNIDEAKQQLSSQGMFVSKIGEKKDLFDFANMFKPKVKLDDLMVFNGQLETIFSVGIPLMKGLEFIEAQTPNPTMKQVLKEIIQDLSEGKEFSQAVAAHPHVFDNTYQHLLVAGEVTGELQTILSRISEIISTKMDNTQKIKSALFYPKLVLSFLVGVFAIAVYFIIPRMQGFYKNMKIELPAITKLMLKLSEILTSPLFIFVTIALIIAFIYFKKLLLDRYLLRIHELLLKTPLFGPLILEIEMSTFCNIMHMLMQNGITQLDSLKILRGILNNQKIIQTIYHCEDVIEEGRTLSFGLNSTNVFPPLLSNFIAIGEEAGDVESIFEKMSVYYKKRVNHNLEIFSRLIEPILLFVIFGAVLFIALAVFMPMWSMTSAARPH